jgi:DNA polymerase III delta prime subunit
MANYLWSEQYRPKTIEDCVLPDRLKSQFQEMVSKKSLLNMVLSGGAGTGKTTVARALCNELGVDVMVINATENGNIDMIRTDVRKFGSTVSLLGDIDTKCIILDEADGLTPMAQGALRGMIEEFSGNCRFIFTANFANKIIEPLKSRNPLIEFNFTKEEKKTLILQFHKRTKQILAEKGITYDNGELAQLVMKNFPDFRKTLNLLQKYCLSGELRLTSSTGLDDDQIKTLVNYLKAKDFQEMRKWVVENLDNDGAMVRRALYDKATDYIKGDSIPQLILFISQYDERESRVVDKEINMVAFLTECMADLQWK